MGTVGLRALRQDASDVVRRVENGEEIDITVSGRVVARMVPAGAKTWRVWDEVSDLFGGRADPDWDRDRDLIDQSPTDPWERNK
jgi:prevent-host-death family protein